MGSITAPKAWIAQYDAQRAAAAKINFNLMFLFIETMKRYEVHQTDLEMSSVCEMIKGMKRKDGLKRSDGDVYLKCLM